jgi:tRNA (cmo5U34)-methyltransferase
MPDALFAARDPELVENFLRNVRGTIPLSIEQIEIILRLIAASDTRVETYLDLGCGGGVVAPAILDEYPAAQATVLETSSRHLEATRRQLGSRDGRAACHVARFHSAEWVRQAEALAPYDLVTSGVELALLPEERQHELFREVFALLRPGGFFLVLEHVASATRWTQSPWDDQMIEAIFGEVLEKDRHRPRTEIAREFYEKVTQEGQKIAPLEVQCDWLRGIGFESVECYLKISEMAVFGGVKPGAGEPEFVTGS